MRQRVHGDDGANRQTRDHDVDRALREGRAAQRESDQQGGDGQSSGHQAAQPVTAFDAGPQDFLQARRANDAAFMFSHALAAKRVAARGTARYRLAIVVHKTALLGDG